MLLVSMIQCMSTADCRLSANFRIRPDILEARLAIEAERRMANRSSLDIVTTKGRDQDEILAIKTGSRAYSDILNPERASSLGTSACP